MKGRKAIPGEAWNGLRRLLRWYLSIDIGTGGKVVCAAITAVLLPVNICLTLHLAGGPAIAVVAIWHGMTAIYVYYILKKESCEREEETNEAH